MSRDQRLSPPARLGLGLWRLFTAVNFAVLQIMIVVIVGLIGMTVTQLPDFAFRSPADYIAQMEIIHAKYDPAIGAGMVAILERLQVFNIFSAWWFSLLLILLVTSIIVCTLNRTPKLWRTSAVIRIVQPDPFYDPFLPDRAVVAGVDAGAVRTALRRSHFHVREVDVDGVHYVYGDRHRWTKLATLISHLGLILFLVAAAVTSRFGFESGIELTNGQSSPVQAIGTPGLLVVKSFGFADPTAADGTVLDYTTDLAVYQDGNLLARKIVRVNDPLSVDGFTFHQNGFRVAPDIVIRDSQGQVLWNGPEPLDDSVAGSPHGVMSVPGEDNVGLEMLLTKAADGTIGVLFQPTTAGTKAGTLTLTASPGGSVAATLGGTALAPAKLTIAPASGASNDFGSILIGKTTLQTFVVANGGQAAEVEGTWSATLEWLVGRLAPRFPALAFAEVRYRIKSWKRLDLCEEDLRAAVAEVGAPRTLLAGFSMGGAVASLAADAPGVEGVLGLAPWLPDRLDLGRLVGRRLVACDQRHRHAVVQRDERVQAALAHDHAVELRLPDRRRVVGVRQDRALMADRPVVGEQEHGVEAAIEALHHVQRLVRARQVRRLAVHRGRRQVVHARVGVVDQEGGRAGIGGAVDRGVHLGQEQPPADLVLGPRPDHLAPVDDPGGALDVGGQVHLGGAHVRTSPTRATASSSTSMPSNRKPPATTAVEAG